MNQLLYDACLDYIDVLYQTRPTISRPQLTPHWKRDEIVGRLEAELAVVADTAAEDRLLTMLELSKLRRRHGWPVWATGRAPASLVIYLFELSIADPLLLNHFWRSHERTLWHELHYGSEPNLSTPLPLRTLPECVEPLSKAVTDLGAADWIEVQACSERERIPFLAEQFAEADGKAVPFAGEPLDRFTLWIDLDGTLREVHYQLDDPVISSAAAAWTVESPEQLAVVTAAAELAAADQADLFGWCQQHETSSSLLSPLTRPFGGMVLFEEQIADAIHELEGDSKNHAAVKARQMTSRDDLATARIEAEFLDRVARRGATESDAWLAFDELRHAAGRCVSWADHLAHATLTGRSLLINAIRHGHFERAVGEACLE